MATTRSSKTATPSKTAVETKVARSRNLSFFGLLYKFNLILATIGLLIWIFVGSFFSISVVEQLKTLAQQKVSNAAPEIAQVAASKDVPIPGIGTVNVECVKAKVKQEVLDKLTPTTGGNDLTDEEKSQFSSCLVQPSPSPSTSPTQ